MKGRLRKYSDGWFIESIVDDNGVKLPQPSRVRVHPEQLTNDDPYRSKYGVDDEVHFEVRTIAMGDSEFNVMDEDVAMIIDTKVDETNEGVNEGVNSVIVSERFRNDFGNNSETIRNDSENSIQETSETNLSSEPLPIQPMSPPDGTGILSSMDIIEEPKQSVRKITLEDIAEKNRGFSVNVPDRKSNNVVERVNLKKS